MFWWSSFSWSTVRRQLGLDVQKSKKNLAISSFLVRPNHRTWTERSVGHYHIYLLLQRLREIFLFLALKTTQSSSLIPRWTYNGIFCPHQIERPWKINFWPVSRLYSEIPKLVPASSIFNGLLLTSLGLKNLRFNLRYYSDIVQQSLESLVQVGRSWNLQISTGRSLTFKERIV